MIVPYIYFWLRFYCASIWRSRGLARKQ